MMYRMEFRKMLRYERAAVCKFQHVIAVSENDRSLMTRWVDGDRVTVVPTGVDLAQYQPDPAASDANASAPLITFVGAMDWEPNVDGVEYFCGEVWPQIKAEVPQPRFHLVSRLLLEKKKRRHRLDLEFRRPLLSLHSTHSSAPFSPCLL